MELVINGGNKLSGEVKLHAAKNAVLPIIACCVLVGEDVVINNVPDLIDIHAMLDIIKSLGGSAEYDEGTVTVNCNSLVPMLIDRELTKRARSSIFILGPILSRFHEAKISYPGGCEIGTRPIDLHLSGLKQLGAEICETEKAIECKGNLNGSEIVLRLPSVGATENIMMAAVLAQGRTIIHNAAKEPEIADLAAFINACGGKVYGAGSDIIIIEGVEKLHGTVYTPISDRIVAGTYMIATAVCGGKLVLRDINLSYISSLVNFLTVAGCRLSYRANDMTVISSGRLSGIPKLSTGYYPYYPTDLQAPMLTLMSVAKGRSELKENLFESRFKHAVWLNEMGADITIDGTTAIVNGVKKLKGKEVFAEDLRGGAALVIAGLKAEGQTIVKNICHIDRGYEKIECLFSAIGGDIYRR